MSRARKTKYDKLLRIGHGMSNLCFNMKQNANLPTYLRERAEELQLKWDEARNELRPAEKGKVGR